MKADGSECLCLILLLLHQTPVSRSGTSTPELSLTAVLTPNTPTPELSLTAVLTPNTPTPELSLTAVLTPNTPTPELSLTAVLTPNTPTPELSLTASQSTLLFLLQSQSALLLLQSQSVLLFLLQFQCALLLLLQSHSALLFLLQSQSALLLLQSQFQVLGPAAPVVAIAGEDVVLPCYLKPSISAEDMSVEWTRTHSTDTLVHLYQEREIRNDNQNPSYRGRTALFPEELKRGNISLRLSSVRVSDEGDEPVISMEGHRGGGIGLLCESKGWHPEPELTWLDSEGHSLSAEDTETHRDSEGFFTVRRRVTVQESNTNRFTCGVLQQQLKQEKQTDIHIPSELFPRTHAGIVVLSFGLAGGKQPVGLQRAVCEAVLLRCSGSGELLQDFTISDTVGARLRVRDCQNPTLTDYSTTAAIEYVLCLTVFPHRLQHHSSYRVCAVSHCVSSQTLTDYSITAAIEYVLYYSTTAAVEYVLCLTVFPHRLQHHSSYRVYYSITAAIEYVLCLTVFPHRLQHHSCCRTLTDYSITAAIEYVLCLTVFPHRLQHHSSYRVCAVSHCVSSQTLTDYSSYRTLTDHSIKAAIEYVLCLTVFPHRKLTDYSITAAIEYVLLDVTLDPDTAHRQLILSEDGKQVKCGNLLQDVIPSPKRFDLAFSVLAKEGFSSGRFYYEVLVGEKIEWTLGVAKESIDTKKHVQRCPENGFWIMRLRNGTEYTAVDITDVPLSLREKPRTVGVYVDYELGQVSFYNAEASQNPAQHRHTARTPHSTDTQPEPHTAQTHSQNPTQHRHTARTPHSTDTQPEPRPAQTHSQNPRQHRHTARTPHSTDTQPEPHTAQTHSQNPTQHRHTAITPHSTDTQPEPHTAQTHSQNPTQHRHTARTPHSTDTQPQPHTAQTHSHNPTQHRHTARTPHSTDTQPEPHTAQTHSQNPAQHRHTARTPHSIDTQHKNQESSAIDPCLQTRYTYTCAITDCSTDT
ncbi:hypothetical protein JZ751_016882 [Albula glossodonta]|uniref:Butyrophilin subfamily 1 member A1-like n=1 Tax=Albula glossodonta TaxID=121402 RepID=A0A8T2MW83_9TELE|nr:hypothetical protein JZ751_016882 [Albula glossodonta]